MPGEAHKTSTIFKLHYILHFLIVFFMSISFDSKIYPAKPFGLNTCMNAINMSNEYPNIFGMPKDAE